MTASKLTSTSMATMRRCPRQFFYGKGYQHLYETFLAVLGDLDAHVRAGRNVVLIMHDCTASRQP